MSAPRHDEVVQKLAELIRGIKVAMLTTVAADGSLHSRPMVAQQAEFDGVLWFFTSAGAPKADEVEHDQHVNVSYVSPEDRRYVSVSGTARLVRDRQKVRQFWGPAYETWFPHGLADPDLALLRVEPEWAESWGTPSERSMRLGGFARAVVGRAASEPGSDEKLDLHDHTG